MNSKQQAAYLHRIAYSKPLYVSLTSLRDLQLSHVLAVPFENIDVHRGVELVLDEEYLFRKIVLQRRGGLCYETNGLFCQFLRSYGFDVEMISGRVFSTEQEYRQEFDHLALLVNLHGEQWLCDVGYGEFAFYPLKISLGELQEDPRGLFRITQYNDEYLVVQKMQGGFAKNEYLFSLKPRDWSDFEGTCYHHQSSADSHIVQRLLCTLPTLNGRMTLSNQLWVEKNGPKSEKRLLGSQQEIVELLRQKFQMELEAQTRFDYLLK